MKWSEPVSVRNYSLLLNLIKFFVTHSDTTNTRVGFKLHSVSKTDVEEFNEANQPFEPLLANTMKSLLNILCILAAPKKMSEEQRDEINVVFTSKAGMKEALEKFWKTISPPAVNTLGLYGIFCEYISYQYRIVKFLYYLTSEAIDLVVQYQELSEIVSSLPLTANQIFLAEIGRAQGLERAQTVSNLLTQLMHRVELYFKIAIKHNIIYS